MHPAPAAPADPQSDLAPPSSDSPPTAPFGVPSPTDAPVLSSPASLRGDAAVGSESAVPALSALNEGAGSIYAAQKKRRSSHVHRSSEDVPVSGSDDNGAPQHIASVSPSTPAEPLGAGADGCLSAEEIAAEKSVLKARLLSIMDEYMRLWREEENSEDELNALYDAKRAELKRKMRAKKAALNASACNASAPSPSGRRLLQQREVDDDWFDQEEAPVYPAEAGGELPVFDDDDRGVAARIIAGGSQSTPKPQIADDEDDDNAPLLDASIHPYHSMPSAFTELSERDIQSRHAPALAASPRSDGELVDVENGGFVASISPARFPGVTPVAASSRNGRSQRDMDEDYEEEKRRRRERLRAMRAQTAAEAADDFDDGAHFVASISPMAPQRPARVFEEDEAFIGSIGPPSAGGQRREAVVERWKAADAKEEELKRAVEERRASSRARLQAIAQRTKPASRP